MENTKKSDKSVSKNNNFKRILKGSIVSIIITLVLLLLMSILLTYTNIPENVIPVSIIIISALSIFIGSIVSTMHIQKNGLLNGGLVGAIYSITIYLLSSIIVSGFSLNIKSIVMLVISIIAGMIGGIIGVNIYKN